MEEGDYDENPYSKLLEKKYYEKDLTREDREFRCE